MRDSLLQPPLSCCSLVRIEKYDGVNYFDGSSRGVEVVFLPLDVVVVRFGCAPLRLGIFPFLLIGASVQLA